MLPRLRLFVKKRGTRRTGTRWAGKVAEGILFAVLLGIGAFALYRLIAYVSITEGAGWWPWFAMVIPAALIVFGTVELLRLLWQSSASTERRAAAVQKATDWELPGADSRLKGPSLPAVPAIDAVTDSPGVRLAHRLPMDAASNWVLLSMVAICLIWNTLVVVFVVQVVKLHRELIVGEDQPKWLLTFLIAPFVMASAWTLIALVRQVMQSIAIGPTHIEVSRHPFYPGGSFNGYLSQTGRLSVRWLQVQLVCEEQAIYQQGTDTRRASCRVFRNVLFSQRKFEIRPQQAFETSFGLTLPPSAMHSFVSPHNAVTWTLVVRGRMVRWGDFERRFPVYVYPLRASQLKEELPPYATTASAI
jgi:hypothetical protein